MSSFVSSVRCFDLRLKKEYPLPSRASFFDFGPSVVIRLHQLNSSYYYCSVALTQDLKRTSIAIQARFFNFGPCTCCDMFASVALFLLLPTHYLKKRRSFSHCYLSDQTFKCVILRKILIFSVMSCRNAAHILVVSRAICWETSRTILYDTMQLKKLSGGV